MEMKEEHVAVHGGDKVALYAQSDTKSYLYPGTDTRAPRTHAHPG